MEAAGAAPLSSWPWENLGSYKYLLYGPLVAKVLHSRPWESSCRPEDLWWAHVLAISALRCLVHSSWCSYGNMLFLTRNRRIVKDGVDFEQIDKEWHWDNFIMLQAFVAVLACCAFPSGSAAALPLWNARGLLWAALLHAVVSEPLFYCAHRLFHGGYLSKHYHSLHHSSPVPQSVTAAFGTPAEHLALCAVMGAPLLGAGMAGQASVALVYGYVLAFDFVRCMHHSNVEVIPHRLFDALPFLRYLISTPTEERGGVGLRVPAACGGRDLVHARALRLQQLRVHALRPQALPPPAVAPRLHGDARHVGHLQDLPHLLLQPPRPPPPDLGRPSLRLPGDTIEEGEEEEEEEEPDTSESK